MDYGKIFYDRSELNKVGIYAFKARENLTAKKIRLILGLYRALSSEFKLSRDDVTKLVIQTWEKCY